MIISLTNHQLKQRTFNFNSKYCALLDSLWTVLSMVHVLESFDVFINTKDIFSVLCAVATEKNAVSFFWYCKEKNREHSVLVYVYIYNVEQKFCWLNFLIFFFRVCFKFCFCCLCHFFPQKKCITWHSWRAALITCWQENSALTGRFDWISTSSRDSTTFLSLFQQKLWEALKNDLWRIKQLFYYLCISLNRLGVCIYQTEANKLLNKEQGFDSLIRRVTINQKLQKREKITTSLNESHSSLYSPQVNENI